MAYAFNTNVSASGGIVPQRRHSTTKERIAVFLADSIAANAAPAEVDWGKPMGKEVW